MMPLRYLQMDVRVGRPGAGNPFGRDGRVMVGMDADGEVWTGSEVQAVIRGTVDWDGLRA